MDEFAAVRSLASGRGDEDVDALATELAGAPHVCPCDRLSLAELLVRDLAGALDLLAETELDPLLAHGNEAAVVTRRHQQAQCVRPDVDNPDTHGADSGHPVGRHPRRVK